MEPRRSKTRALNSPGSCPSLHPAALRRRGNRRNLIQPLDAVYWASPVADCHNGYNDWLSLELKVTSAVSKVP
jgi:hypothetical protein